ncbi:MAG: Rrf2 family transcriptional regulator [Lentimicrobium sp.]
MSKIISLSEAASIAVHSMVLIASAKESLNVIKISERTGASRHHVAKILQRLVKEGFLNSSRGPAGGFILRIPAANVTLLQIYEAIEGKLEEASCPVDSPVCPFQKCLMGNIVSKMTREFKKYMSSQTLSDFISN